MSMGILVATQRTIASILGRAKAAIVLIAQKNALTKLSNGHQADEAVSDRLTIGRFADF
jgi:hypothetical protein